MIMPGDFIPLAERTGLIAPISEWVVEEACRQGRVWRDAGLDLYVSVNLPAAFWEPTAMRHVLDTIESFGLSPDRMMIEITESTAAREGLGDAPILAELHERGLRLAIDDFGTGHSSLDRLHRMAVTTLKIDRSFVAGVPPSTARACWSRRCSGWPTGSASRPWRRASRPRPSAPSSWSTAARSGRASSSRRRLRPRRSSRSCARLPRAA